MAKIAYIKELYENEGLSLNEIARQTGKNFRMVQKYAYQTNWSEEEKPIKPGNFPVMDEYIKVIDSWLEQDEKEPRKQRHTVKRIFERL
ncbi:hypothetical protein FACS189499_09060 [Clostridia bacterium]|nr:hypothetical protein FACS189499_09060 [Clostridia bacterium]